MESSFGKGLIVVGLAISIVGLVIVFSDRLTFFKLLGRLPGDFNFKGESWQIYVPLTTSLLVSALVTGILWILSYFSKRGGP